MMTEKTIDAASVAADACPVLPQNRTDELSLTHVDDEIRAQSAVK
jgi:hypothetical protein